MPSTVSRVTFLSALLLVFTFLGPFSSFLAMPGVQAANNQDVQLYLHRLPANVSVSGFQTSEIFNATTLWGGPSITPDLRNAPYNFTLYPALALDLTSRGAGSVDLWVTVSGAPGTVNATLYEVNAAGLQLIVSSFVTVANNTDPTVPYQVRITFNIDHVFSQSSTIKLSLAASAVGHLYTWYDSPSYRSVLNLPTVDVPRVSLIDTFDSNLSPQNRFSLNWTEPQRVVFANIHVADPFGAYHVANATLSIRNPASSPVFSAVANPFSANPGSPEKLFGVNWAYDSNLPTGNYTFTTTAFDVSGNQGVGTAQASLYIGISVPGQQPQPPSQEQPNTWMWSILAIGLIAALLGFLLFYRRTRTKCPKCGTMFNRKLSRCPSCGAEISVQGSAVAKPS